MDIRKWTHNDCSVYSEPENHISYVGASIFILSISNNRNVQQIQTLLLESLELILHCLATHVVVDTWKESAKTIYQLQK